jgi:hypothetical protein
LAWQPNNASDTHYKVLSQHAESGRFFKTECGDGFKLDRTFMAWLKDGKEKTMGEAADEWLRRVAIKRQE